MRFFLIVIVAVVGVHFSWAQNRDRKFKFKLPEGKHFFVVPPDSSWTQMPWKDSVYIFPGFGEGRIEYKSGYSTSHHLKMNYNVLFETFMIMQDDGRVIPFKDIEDIRYVWIDDNKFVRTKGYGYLYVIQDGRAALAESTFMDVILEYPVMPEYPNAFVDQRYEASKVKRYFYIEKAYYIIDTSSGRVKRASPKALSKIFRKEKQTIRDFGKTNNIDYNKKDDLMKVVLFCNREL